ncbi:MoaD/ThiS family protein [Marinicella sp. W31]|uniref:MoaD/ThiS family protein n=1 Tax=Marinicella sp. W31 TaxID=3023713 RepID=UPI0037578747
MNITIEYYGRLQDSFGNNSEKTETTGSTLLDVFQQQCQKHQLDLSVDDIRPVINDSFAEWSDHCQEGDVIGFLPPAAGG